MNTPLPGHQGRRVPAFGSLAHMGAWLCAFSKLSLVPTFVAFLILAQSPVHAQPPTPNPAAPTLAAPFPMGAQRGTTIELTLTGTNLNDPVGVLTSFPAKITIPTENNNGKDPAKLLVRMEVPRDAPLGWHTVRLATSRGVSNFRLSCLDDLPQVLESADNRTPASAQAVPVPAVVCGRVDAEQTDYFKFHVEAGQRLSFEVLGRRLGSGLDPIITLINPRGGKPLAMSDDAPGQSKDPRFTYTFKEAGDYLLEVRDVRHQGGADWYYRLRIGDFPMATTPVPLAARRGSAVQVSFAGPHVEGIPPLSVNVPTEPDLKAIWLAPTWPTGGVPGWPVVLALSDDEEALENEPNDEASKANRLGVPSAVSGRMQRKYDKDFFVFAGKKGQRIVVDAVTQEQHSPTVLYLVLKNAKGNQVAASNPANDPARIDFTLPEDGDYTLVVEHLHYWGGPDETYRLTVQPYAPGFTLTAGLDRHDAPQGGTAIIHVSVARRDFNGPIELSVAGPPGVQGSAVIPAGQNGTLLAVQAGAEAPIAGHRLNIIGKATINDKPVVEQASVRSLVSQNLGNLAFPPMHLHNELALGVTEKPPFTIQATYDQPEGLRGGTTPVTIQVARNAGFDEEITVTLVTVPPVQGQPVPIPPATVKVPKGQAQAKLELKPAGNAPLGPQTLGYIARAKFNGKDVTASVLPSPLPLTLPFDLQVDTRGGVLNVPGLRAGQPAPSPFHLADLLNRASGSATFGMLDLSHVRPAPNTLKVKVTAVRKGGYKGPIALEFRNLPANVTAPKPAIPEGQTEVEVDLTAAANAAVGAKGDVNVLGTATGLANQQNASPNFTVNVVK